MILKFLEDGGKVGNVVGGGGACFGVTFFGFGFGFGFEFGLEVELELFEVKAGFLVPKSPGFGLLEELEATLEIGFLFFIEF